MKGAIINEVGMLNCASEDLNPICAPWPVGACGTDNGCAAHMQRRLGGRFLVAPVVVSRDAKRKGNLRIEERNNRYRLGVIVSATPFFLLVRPVGFPRARDAIQGHVRHGMDSGILGHCQKLQGAGGFQ